MFCFLYALLVRVTNFVLKVSHCSSKLILTWHCNSLHLYTHFHFSNALISSTPGFSHKLLHEKLETLQNNLVLMEIIKATSVQFRCYVHLFLLFPFPPFLSLFSIMPPLTQMWPTEWVNERESANIPLLLLLLLFPFTPAPWTWKGPPKANGWPVGCVLCEGPRPRHNTTHSSAGHHSWAGMWPASD